MDEIPTITHGVSKLQIAITIGVVFIIIFLSFTYKNNPTPASETIKDINSKVDTSWPSSQVDQSVINEDTKVYKINAVYPVVKDVGISNKMKSFVDEQIAQFKDDTSWATDPSISSASEGELSFDINFEKSKSAKTETYIFTTSTYTGGAHGMQYANTMTFSSTGKMITIKDLFTDTKGLVLVSNFVKKELATRENANQSFIDDGASARSENYENFAVTDGGLIVIFDPYQVAPYSSGFQKVTVPISIFKTSANKDIF